MNFLKKTALCLSLATASALAFSFVASPSPSLKLALVKYSGGGDWYSIVDALSNFARFCNEKLNTNLDLDHAIVEVGSAEIFNYPFLFMTGHGNVVFSDQEAENLRNYLLGGGFLLIDDDFGMSDFIRPAMKKVFPEHNLVELPAAHPIFQQPFAFPKGLPKIHKHNDNSPEALAIFHEGRMVCLYLFESNISDGWESFEVHKNPEELRQTSLRMGANILSFAFSQ